MKADAKAVSEILGGPNQYLVPFFQRFYSWKRKNWERLWSDLLFLMGEGKGGQHFLGPLVITPFEPGPSEVHRFQLIDGQQRLTTLSLLLAALRDAARKAGSATLGDAIHEDYLVQKRQEDLLRFRVVPRTGDREAFFEILVGDPDQATRKLGVTKAYLYFRRQITEWLEEDQSRDLKELRHAILALLNLVTISIDGENPYEIFESLNSTGLPLEEADLVRNYVFMLLPQEKQESYQKQYWQRIEDLLSYSAKLPPKIGTLFYRNYLMRNGRYIERTGTFVSFKEDHKQSRQSPQALSDQLHRFATYEIDLRMPERVQDKKLGASFERIVLLDVTTAHPLLMNLMDRYDREEIDRKELIGCFDDLASFVLRRSICGESTRTYGRWFTEAIGEIRDSPREDLRRVWHRRGWPDDGAFKERLLEFPVYHRERRKARLILQQLEYSYAHKERVEPGTLSIEHVMPQRIAKNRSGTAWKKMLGDEWDGVHEKWLHTIGNLTLTGYNPDMSNKPFDRKKPALRESNLVLNKYFSRLQVWNGDSIEKRGGELAKEVAKLFPRPKGLEPYQPSEDATGNLEDAGSAQKFRKEYWSRLNETLRDQGSAFARERTDEHALQDLPTPWERMKLRARVYPKLREIRLEVSFVWKMGRTAFEHLLDQKDRIDTEFGGELFWDDEGGYSISVSREDADVKNEEHWDSQHDWIVEQLDAFDSVVFSRVKKIVERLEGGESNPASE